MKKKAVISNKIFLNCPKGSDLEDKLRSELTYEINQQPVSEYPLVVKHLERISDTVVAFPSGRLDLIPEDYELIDKRSYADAVIPNPAFTLRENQAEARDFFSDGSCGLVNCKPGWGKSICAMSIAHMLQLKTLIVTTTTIIRDMWAKEIKQHFGIEPCIIGGGKIVNEGSPIAVGNIQTVEKIIQKYSGEYGLVIVDECHHCSANTFMKVLNVSRASVKIGLSGTLTRRDGKHVFFQDFFTNKVFIGKDENRMTPTIWNYQSEVMIPNNQMIPWAKRANAVMEDPRHISDVIFITKCLEMMGHKVLIVADRVDFLSKVHQALPYSLMITGSVASSVEEREQVMDAIRSGKATSICATQSIFSEGVSLNELSALVPASLISGEELLEQLIGRIQRPAANKKQPIAVDINLSGNTGKRQAYKRKGLYIREGWKIQQQNRATLISMANNE
jgi:superfamily II DNA or RNA helicase